MLAHSMSTTVWPEHKRTLRIQQEKRGRVERDRYIGEALKAFKLVKIDGRTFYTCNVARLKDCNRLGEDKEVSLWRTHFFWNSEFFLEVDAVIFSGPPGLELAGITFLLVDAIFIALSDNEILNPCSGERVVIKDPLQFASPEIS